MKKHQIKVLKSFEYHSPDNGEVKFLSVGDFAEISATDDTLLFWIEHGIVEVIADEEV